MKKLRNCLLLLVLLLCSLFGLAACGGDGGGGDKGGPVVPEKIIFDYDEKTGTLKWNQVEGLTDIIVTVNGEEIAVNGGSYNIKDLNLVDGRYSISVTYSYRNEIKEDSGIMAVLGEPPTGDKIELTFLDINRQTIKTIYKNRTDKLTQEDFPKIFDKTGVKYTWNAKVGDSLDTISQIQLSAEFERYAVTFNLNGGALVGEPIEYYTVENKTIPLSTPTKAGYKFNGWYLSSDFSGEKVNRILTSWCKDITLHAKFIEGTTDEKAVIEALTYAANAKEVTMSMKQESQKHEMAYSLNDGIYIHEKNNGKNYKIITGGMYYDYGDNKTYYALSGEENTVDYYMDPLGFLEMTSLLQSITTPTSEKDGFKTTATFARGTDTESFTIYYADGKLTRIIFMSDGVDVSLKYSVTKLTPSNKGLSLAVKVKVFVAYVDSVDEPPNISVTSEIFLKTSVAFKDNEEIKRLISGKEKDFEGFYADEKLETLATYDNINGKLYLKFIREEIKIALTKFTLNFHCDCSECKGKVTTINNVSLETMEFTDEFEHFSTFIYGGYYKIEDGAEITGYYEQDLQTQICFKDFSYKLYTIYQQGGSLENLVFDIYTKKELKDTIKVKIHYIENTTEVFTKETYAVIGNGINGYWRDLPLNYRRDLEKYDIYKDTSWEYDSRIEMVTASTKDAYVKVVKGINATVHLGKAIIFGGGKDAKSEITRLNYPNSKISDAFDDLLGYRVEENGKMLKLSGFYYDEGLTRLAKLTDIIDKELELYASWGEEKEVTLVEKEGLNLLSDHLNVRLLIDGDIFAALTKQLPYDNSDNVFQQYNDDYIYVSKFYKDAARTIEVTTYDGTYDKLYIGYVETPTMTINCPDGCQGQVHSCKIIGGRLSDNDLPQTHYIDINGNSYNIYLYFDKECTQIFGYNPTRYYEDFTIYGKTDVSQRTVTLHCNCLLHGEHGVEFSMLATENLHEIVFGKLTYFPSGKVEYTPGLCDFGYKIDSSSNYNFYTDEECEKEYYNFPISEEPLFLYLPKTTIVYVYGGLGINDDHKVAMCNIDKIFANQINFNKNYGFFREEACINTRIISANFKPKTNEKLYFKEIVSTENPQTLTIKASGQQDKTFSRWDDYKYVSYESFHILGYYYDDKLTDPIEYTDDLTQLNTIRWMGNATIYAKLEADPKINIISKIEGITGEEITCSRPNETYVQALNNIALYAPYKEGHMLALTRTENGTDYIDLNTAVEAGEYYLCYKSVADTHIKITFSCNCGHCHTNLEEKGLWFEGEKIGTKDHIYVPKGDYKKYLIAFDYISGHAVIIDGEKIYVGKNQISLYANSARTEILDNFTSTSDVVIYAKPDTNKITTLILHIENETYQYYCSYDGGNSKYHTANHFASRVNQNQNNGYAINYLDFIDSLPELFNNGKVVTGCYTDKDCKNLYEIDYNDKSTRIELYCTVGNGVNLTVVLTVDGQHENSQKYLFLQGRTFEETRIFYGSPGEQTPEGHELAFTYTYEGTDYVDKSTQLLNDTKIYKIFKRNSMLKVDFVCDCGLLHSAMFVAPGYDISQDLSYFAHGGYSPKDDSFTVKYYKDDAKTIEMLSEDFIINADITIYMKVEMPR